MTGRSGSRRAPDAQGRTRTASWADQIVVDLGTLLDDAYLALEFDIVDGIFLVEDEVYFDGANPAPDDRNAPGTSTGRRISGLDTDNSSFDFALGCPTPGASNNLICLFSDGFEDDGL